MKNLMRWALHTATVIAVLFCYISATAQTITGVINTYTAVSNINVNQISVNSSVGFTQGDKVLLIQMKGATASLANGPTFGTLTAYGNAGNYEFATIQSVVGNTITLTKPVCQSYTIAGLVQLVRVPVFNNVTITGTIFPQPWNGTTGGIVALEVTGTLTMNAGISVSGNGFRGGGYADNNFDCSEATFAGGFASAVAGRKGEAIVEYPAGQDAARMPLGNGGGGANKGNPGAGGGSNFGAGGRGGNPALICGNSGIFGVGGYPLAVATNKAFMGGGGGGGFRDNGQAVTNGGNGGGLVFLRAGTINANGNTINASGGTVGGTTSDEGAGGAGAGGAVFLWTNTVSSALTINVSGGRGGNVQNTINTNDAQGTGGGGGGGYACFSTAAVPPNVTVNTAGGAAGTILHAGAYLNSTFGAASGAAGSSLFNLPNPPLALDRPNLGNDTTICQGTSFTLNAGAGYASYLWQNSSTNQTFQTTPTGGLYWVQVPNGCGGTLRDSINVTIFNANINLGPDTTLCSSDSLLLYGGFGFPNYLWSDGTTNPGTFVKNPGVYWVRVTSANGCTSSDTMRVLGTVPSPVFSLGGDTVLCQGQGIVLTPGPGFTTYIWNNGFTGSQQTINNSGTYWAEVTNANGCRTRDSIVITASGQPPQPNLGPDVSLCPGNSALFNPGNFTSYLWQDGSSTPTFTGNIAGTYWVQVGDGTGCFGRDSITLTYFTPPVVNLGPDRQLCSGSTITFNAGAGFAIYQWQDNTTNQTYTANNTGNFFVTVTDFNGCSSTDSVQITGIVNPPVISLGADTSFCAGGSTILSPGAGFNSYLWSNGSTGGSLTVSATGTYYVTVTDANGCSDTDTMRVTGVFPLPNFSLGANFNVCEGEPVILNPGLTGTYTYYWNDDSQNPTLQVELPGKYWVRVTDVNGCTATDTIEGIDKCPSTLYVPSAFTPNTDLTNPIFKAYGRNIERFRMDIFDRWGELVYTCYSIDQGWDGRTNVDEVAPQGIYSYRIVYTDPADPDDRVVIGRFTLFR